jgi:hypothetical protein
LQIDWCRDHDSGGCSTQDGFGQLAYDALKGMPFMKDPVRDSDWAALGTAAYGLYNHMTQDGE